MNAQKWTALAIGLVLVVAGAAQAQLLQPVGQTREVYGQATGSLDGENQDTGLIVHQPAEGDYGVWNDPATGSVQFGSSASASFVSGYNGGWNGDDTLFIDSVSGNMSGGGGPGFEATAMAGQRFIMRLHVSQPLDWTLTLTMGGSRLTSDGMLMQLERTDQPAIVFQYAVPGPDGSLDPTEVSGSLAPGEYTLTYRAEGSVHIVGPGGDGGGYGINFNFHVTASTLVPGDLNCDGTVDFGDINPFVLALSDPAGYATQYPNCNIMNGDINGDGQVGFGDINPFVELLTH